MRDETYIEYDTVDSVDGEGRTGWKAIAGALASIAVLLLIVVWSYRLGVRDAHDVPVIRAMVQDMRIAPADPGGAQMAHQDRAVYELIAAVPSAASDDIDLAPEPEALADEDLPMELLAPETVMATPEPPAARPAMPATTLDDLVAAVLATETGAGALDGPSSPLPSLRPTRVTAPAATIVASAASASDATVPTRGAAQGPAIQLGAYLSPDDALTMWRALARRNGDLLAGREPVVSQLVGANRTLYGLRAGPFETVAEARGLCAALQARNEDCLVTELR